MITRKFLALGALALVLAQQARAQQPLAFENVTVVDVADGRLLPAQTVVVTGNRIAAVAPANAVALPKDARVVDATGKFLVPGFWDMHAHVDSRAREEYPRHIANGVTGLREMAQRFPHGADSFRVWQREVARGALVGPRSVGPSADLLEINGGLAGNGGLATPERVRRVMDSLKAAGDAFVKFHGFEAVDNPRLYLAILRSARRVGLPVVGHTLLQEFGVGLDMVSDSGQHSIEHLVMFNECVATSSNSFAARFERYEMDSVAIDAACARVARAVNRNGTWLTPTLAVDEEFLRNEYRNDSASGREEKMRAFHQGTRRAIQTMRRAGIRNFLAGSDVRDGGFPLLEEMLLLHRAGLSSLEALQAATINPAESFNAADSLGTVTPGKLADLVLLDGDPLADIGNVMRIRAVVANGRYFDRAALDALDPEAAERAKAYLASRPAP